ncbi:hypothetical protein PM082_020076 [Marasmius tenuissimus]|nr:hypothetical protein PM082_020076 [Marasmius tenuissimus]
MAKPTSGKLPRDRFFVTTRSVSHARFQEELAEIVEANLNAKARKLKNLSHLLVSDVSKFQDEDIRKLIGSEYEYGGDEWPREFRLEPISVPQPAETGLDHDQYFKDWFDTYIQKQRPGIESSFVFGTVPEAPRCYGTIWLRAMLVDPEEDDFLTPDLLLCVVHEQIGDEGYDMYDSAGAESWLYPCLIPAGKPDAKLSLWRYKPYERLAYKSMNPSPFAIVTIEGGSGNEGLVKSILHGYIRMRWAYQLANKEEKAVVENLCILCLWVPEGRNGNNSHSWATVLCFRKSTREGQSPSIISINKRFRGLEGKVKLFQLITLVLHRNRGVLSDALQERFSDAAMKMEACLETSLRRFIVPTPKNLPSTSSGKKAVVNDYDDDDRQRQKSGGKAKSPRFIRTEPTFQFGDYKLSSTIPRISTAHPVLPFRCTIEGDKFTLSYCNTHIEVLSPWPAAIDLGEDGTIVIVPQKDKRNDDGEEDNDDEVNEHADYNDEEEEEEEMQMQM